MHAGEPREGSGASCSGLRLQVSVAFVLLLTVVDVALSPRR